MKQVITMICCILIIIFSGIYEVKYLERTSRYMMSDIEYIENAIKNNNYDMASDQMSTMYESWENMKNIWNIFINHEEIDKVDEYMVELKNNILYQDEQKSIESAEEIKNTIYHLYKRQSLRIENIL